jgi:hypothetical protein
VPRKHNSGVRAQRSLAAALIAALLVAAGCGSSRSDRELAGASARLPTVETVPTPTTGALLNASSGLSTGASLAPTQNSPTTPRVVTRASSAPRVKSAPDTGGSSSLPVRSESSAGPAGPSGRE